MVEVKKIALAGLGVAAVGGIAWFLWSRQVTRSAHQTDPEEQALEQAVQKLFQDSFGGSPLTGASAPGRVNLIGEHTDYNDGFVMPIGIHYRTLVVGRPNGLDRFRIVSLNQGGVLSEIHAASLLEKGKEKHWTDYVRGVLAQFINEKILVPPMDIAIASNVPLGGGLSSSASLEMALCTLLNVISEARFSSEKLAVMSQKSEHEYAGVPCGIMDQIISGMAREGQAMLLDCRSLRTQFFSVNFPGVVILVASKFLFPLLINKFFRYQC